MIENILKKRILIIQTVRRFFDEHGFLEVQTPVLQKCPGMEVHLSAFETRLNEPVGMGAHQMFLHTSPEFAMKKLLAKGWNKIYQICPCFRNEEYGLTHRPEFTMLEFYEKNTDYRRMMELTESLMKTCGKAVGFDVPDFEKISVREAFLKYASVDLIETLPEGYDLNPNPEKIIKIAHELGLHPSDNDTWEDAFFRIMLELVEPKLGVDKPTILYDYPVALGALAKTKDTDIRFAERFEVYAGGMEIGNAFSELTDATEQRNRFVHDMKRKKELYGISYPIDEEFMTALDKIDKASGIAIGLDRMIMYLTDQKDIADVLFVDV